MKALALFPLKASKKFKFGTWDVETGEGWWDIQCIGVFDGTDYHYFGLDPVREFLEFILTKKYKSWRWFAHNGGRYDDNFIFDWLCDHPYFCDFKFYCAGSRVLGMTLREGKTKKGWRCLAKLADSLALLPGASLLDLTEKFDVAHKKHKEQGWKSETLKQRILYNRNDCLGLYEVLERFFQETGQMRETVASQALAVFRRSYQKFALWVPAQHVEDFCMSAYYGGRTEVFKRSGHCRSYDVRSMYPACMMEPVPTYYVGDTREIDVRPDGFAFLEAEVFVPECYVPPLAQVHGKLLFPCGHLRGRWSHLELQSVADLPGVRIKILDGKYFMAEPIFAEYVTDFYQRKEGSPEPLRTIYKYLLNALYGKFAQGREKKVFAQWNHQEGFGPVYVAGKETGIAEGWVYNGSGHILPHIAAAITARARVRLWEFLCSTDPYYCDTDSIFTTETMETGEQLGALAPQSDPIDCTFYQAKLYRMGETWKAKGLPVSERMLSDYVRNLPIEFERNTSIKESLRAGESSCRRVTIVKRMAENEKPKRVWTGDGDTRPWFVNREGTYL